MTDYTDLIEAWRVRSWYYETDDLTSDTLDAAIDAAMEEGNEA